MFRILLICPQSTISDPVQALKDCLEQAKMAGADGSGKEEVANEIQYVMDSHYITTFALGDPTEEERERPRMWLFWQALPPKGRIGIFMGSWYGEPIRNRTFGTISKAEFEQSLQEINRFEKMLTDEGALVLKFWFYLTHVRCN